MHHYEESLMTFVLGKGSQAVECHTIFYAIIMWSQSATALYSVTVCVCVWSHMATIVHGGGDCD